MQQMICSLLLLSQTINTTLQPERRFPLSDHPYRFPLGNQAASQLHIRFSVPVPR
jgi:hypothetical protein